VLQEVFSGNHRYLADCLQVMHERLKVIEQAWRSWASQVPPLRAATKTPADPDWTQLPECCTEHRPAIVSRTGGRDAMLYNVCAICGERIERGNKAEKWRLETEAEASVILSAEMEIRENRRAEAQRIYQIWRASMSTEAITVIAQDLIFLAEHQIHTEATGIIARDISELAKKEALEYAPSPEDARAMLEPDPDPLT
jgi:hypothetical protein